jgi:hypothetical protein
MKASALNVGLGLLVAASVRALSGAASSDPALAAGIEEVKAGRAQQGIAILSEFVSRAAGDAKRQEEVAEAYLYLGVAYASLGQRSPALSQFLQALRRNPSLELRPADAPPAAREVFDEARREAASLGAAAGEKKKKGSKAPLLIAGAATVAGAGAAIAGGGKESPPASSPTPTPTFSLVTAFGGTILLLNADPPPGSTVRPGAQAPNMVFRFVLPADVPEKVQLVVELLGAPGPCWRTTSAVLAQPPGTEMTVGVGFTPQPPSCAPPFTTVALQARVVDAASGDVLFSTSYSGGYTVNP